MTLPDTYSRRKRAASGAADVYQYEDMPHKLRRQIIQILSELNLHLYSRHDTFDVFRETVRFMRKELGLFKLSKGHTEQDEFAAWFSNHDILDDLLDALEFSAKIVAKRGNYEVKGGFVQNSLSEINGRMLEAGFGFQLEGLQIIQINSQFLHSQVIIPALSLLREAKYAAAEHEFRQAHDEFRAGEYEDCIHDCGNALESVLKVILTGKGWTFAANDTASKLIAAAFANGLIPDYMQAEFTGLRTMLESGTPTLRNKNGGHGAGTNPRNIPSHIAAFQLHQTAAAIVLLVEAAK